MSLDLQARPRPVLVSLLPLALIALAVGVATSIFLPFVALFLSSEVRASPVQVTLFLVVQPLAGMLVSIALGRLSDRRPVRRPLLIITGAAGVLSSVSAAYVRDFWLLLALAVTITAVSVTCFPQTFAYARQALARLESGRAAMGISTLRTVYSAAWVGGPSLAAVLLANGGFRLVYLFSAAMFALMVLVAIFWLDEPPPIPSSDSPADAPSASPVSPSDPELAPAEKVSAASGANAAGWVIALAVIAFTLLQVPLTLGLQALPIFVVDDLGGSTGNTGVILGLCAALEIPLMLGTGLLATRLKLHTLIVAGAVCGAAYYAVASVAGEVWVLLAGQVLNALFISAVTGIGISFMQDMLPREPGRATTLFSNTYTIGAVLAGPLIGLAQTMGIRSAYVMCTLLCVAGLGLLLPLRGRR